MDIFDDLNRTAGQAPGPDGLIYGSLGRSEKGNVVRGVSQLILTGTYRPGPARTVNIPKPKGGHRALTLRSILDRIVATALRRAMEPLWEAQFLPESMGFRPGRSTFHLLASLEHTMMTQDYWVLTIDDVHKAFDNVSIDRVMATQRQLVTNEDLLALVHVVLQGDDCKRTRGIDQGCPYSPLALNGLLHHHHDLIMNQNRYWYRYADNLVYACQDVAEGHQILEEVERYLRHAGLHLKREDGVKDLRRGETAQSLGFSLRRTDGRLSFDLDEQAWTKLRQDLTDAHKAENPSLMAIQAIRGWVNAYGPALEYGRDQLLQRVSHFAIHHGYRELPSRETMEEWCQAAWERWLTIREEVRQQFQTSEQGDQPCGVVPPTP
jgi:hypothetical protein